MDHQSSGTPPTPAVKPALLGQSVSAPQLMPPLVESPVASATSPVLYRALVPQSVQNAVHELGHALVGFIGKLPIEGLWLYSKGKHAGGVVLPKASMDLNAPPVVLSYLATLMGGYGAELNQADSELRSNPDFLHDTSQAALGDFARALSVLAQAKLPIKTSTEAPSIASPSEDPHLIPAIDGDQIEKLLMQADWSQEETQTVEEAKQSAQRLLKLPVVQAALETAQRIQRIIPVAVQERMVDELVDVPMLSDEQAVGLDKEALQQFWQRHLSTSQQTQMRTLLDAFIKQQQPSDEPAMLSKPSKAEAVP